MVKEVETLNIQVKWMRLILHQIHSEKFIEIQVLTPDKVRSCLVY